MKKLERNRDAGISDVVFCVHELGCSVNEELPTDMPIVHCARRMIETTQALAARVDSSSG